MQDIRREMSSNSSDESHMSDRDGMEHGNLLEEAVASWFGEQKMMVERGRLHLTIQEMEDTFDGLRVYKEKETETK